MEFQFNIVKQYQWTNKEEESLNRIKLTNFVSKVNWSKKAQTNVINDVLLNIREDYYGCIIEGKNFSFVSTSIILCTKLYFVFED